MDELFPSQYKNPSHDTKLNINKITSSSSGSNKDTSSNEKIINNDPLILSPEP
jgi:hypothetical protein